MRETYRKYNHNQSGDNTKPCKTRYLRKHCLIADYVKIISDTTGLFDHLADPKLDVLDRRGKNIEYSFHFIVTIGVLACCLGIFTLHTYASAFTEPYALENVSYLTHEDTSIVIDYQAISDAISKIDDVSWIEGLAQDICEKMQRSGRYRKYYKWYGCVVVVDATDYAFFKSFHCIHDLTATFHKGTKEEKTYYFHKALVARLFFTKTISFPIGVEFIENQEQNPSKQDCENEAAIRLLKRIKRRFPLMLFIICGDALYANKTFIHLCIANDWNYLFTLKEGCQPSLCGEFNSMEQQGLASHAKVRYERETGTVYWANDMGIFVNDPLPMNILRYRTTITVVKGKKKARGIQNAILRRKDIDQNMPELSKDQSKYNLDERKPGKKSRKQAEDAARKTTKSDKAKKDLSQINAALASEIDDGEISGGRVKDGGTIDISFMYITNIHISKENVGDLLVRGRLRWMIEETFLSEKVGQQKLEHLRSKDPKVMKFYFWMECIADSCMQIYLDYSRADRVFGSEQEVYRKLRESFEKDSLKDNYDTGRECHWHYENDKNAYPTVEILPDDAPQKTDQGQDRKESSGAADADAGPERKPVKHISEGIQKKSPVKAVMADNSCVQSYEKNISSETADNPEEDKTDKKMVRGKSPAPDTHPGASSARSESVSGSGGRSKTGKTVSDRASGRNNAGREMPQHENRGFFDIAPVAGKSKRKAGLTAAGCREKKMAHAGKDDKGGAGDEGTGPQPDRGSDCCYGNPDTRLPADGHLRMDGHPPAVQAEGSN